MSSRPVADRNLALEAVRVTEAAALAAARFMGRGDERAADNASQADMNTALAMLNIDGVVRIGPSGTDSSAPLHVGEKAGSGRGPAVDVALMPLEGTTITARGGTNALSVIAISENGHFLNVPDIYMNKIAVGPGVPDGAIELDREPGENLRNLAEVRGVDVGDLVVCILDRPRHREIISKVREAGARIMLITDGDVSGAIATALPSSGVDMYMGIGGAPQGVLTAAAMRCAGGLMQARLVFRSGDERRLAVESGIADFERKYDALDMATGELTFAATGVTPGAMLDGVRIRHGRAITQSLVMRSTTGTLRYVEAHHVFPQG